MTTSTRISVDEYFSKMAILVSLRGACVRRKVGCVLVNSLNHVLATGYNGRARGIDNCLQSPCSGSESSSGTNLEGCEAIHAEQNALLQCGNVDTISTAYCTSSPCIHCLKLLMNTSCSRIVFSEKYPGHERLQVMWETSGPGRTWEYMPIDEFIVKRDKPRCEHLWEHVDNPTETTETLMCTKCHIKKEVGI